MLGKKSRQQGSGGNYYEQSLVYEVLNPIRLPTSSKFAFISAD